MLNKSNPFLPLFLILFIAASISGQSTQVLDTIPDFANSTTIFQKMVRDSFHQVILETDFDTLFKYKKASKNKYNGKIVFKNEANESIKMDIKIEVRGRSRRKACAMPPLKIDFSKKELKKLGLFPDFDKLKLVTHCQNTEGSDQVLLKEYWAYKLYNQLTPKSYRVHFINITYINSNNPKNKLTRLAFFIENNNELAYRLGGEQVGHFGMTPSKLDKTSYHNTLLFQYMIGNADWDVRVRRNIKLIKPQNDSLLIVVPYDFDYAGLVSAPYARLNPDLKQTNIEQRFCLGAFASKEDLNQTIQRFLALKDSGFKCYRSCPNLSKKFKKRMDKYLNSFYELLLNEPQEWEKEFKTNRL